MLKDKAVFAFKSPDDLIEVADTGIEENRAFNEFGVIFMDKNDAEAYELLVEDTAYIKNPAYLFITKKSNGELFRVIASNNFEELLDMAVQTVDLLSQKVSYTIQITNGDMSEVFWNKSDLDATLRYLGKTKAESSDKPTVYFDLDGTCAKWYKDGKGLTYPEQILDPNFHYYRDLEKHQFTVEFAKVLQNRGADVAIISAADPKCIHDKLEWVRNNMPFIKEENIFFCPIGADKTNYVKDNIRCGSVLVDDYNKNLYEWKASGGVSLKLINSVNSKNDNFGCVRCDLAEAPADYEFPKTKDNYVYFWKAILEDAISLVKETVPLKDEPKKNRGTER